VPEEVVDFAGQSTEGSDALVVPTQPEAILSTDMKEAMKR
jgi:hypothetical protein